MKPIYILFTALVILASCKKEEPTPKDNTVNNPPAPTTTTRAFAISASSPAFGGTTYGQLYVFLNGNQINQTTGNGVNESIGTPSGIPGAVFYKFTIGTVYHMELAVGSSYQYKADVKFDSNGNMIEEYVDPNNTVSWVNSNAPNNPIVFL